MRVVRGDGRLQSVHLFPVLAVPSPDSRKPWSRLRVALFFMALFVPLAIMSTPVLRALTSSRTPAYPEWSWRVGELKRYASRFEVEFNAALPYREMIAALSRSVYVDWLGMSPVPEAVLGTDGWLYYTGPARERMLDRHVRGRAPFAPEELELWRSKLIERTQRFRSIGARYVFVVAPNKESVYPEHLPGWVGPKVGPSHLEQLMAHVKAVPDLTVIDLRPSVIADKSAGPLYFKADTHWNARGAYAAYREIMRVLAPEFPGLVARSWAEASSRSPSSVREWTSPG